METTATIDSNLSIAQAQPSDRGIAFLRKALQAALRLLATSGRAAELEAGGRWSAGS
jgi:hypothetical protein